MALEVYHWTPTRTYQGNIDNYNAIQARNAAATAASLNNQQLTLNTKTPDKATTNIIESNELDSDLFNSIINKKKNEWLRHDHYFLDNNDGDDQQIWMHDQISTGYKNFNPHVSGFYYIHMVPGTWVNKIGNYEHDKKFGEFSSGGKKVIEEVTKSFGQLATDIDIPQLNMEYEVISGKNRSLNYATRTSFTGDFTINFIEDYNLNVFRYHELWFKYIEALRKGYIIGDVKESSDSEMFMDVPYFNAVWIAIFKPFSMKIQGLIKIMGVSPVSLPFKQIIGDRAKNTLTTINHTYKSTDMVHKFYSEFDKDINNSAFFKEFLNDISAAKNK